MILRLVPAHADELDRALGAIDDLLIVRRGDGCFVVVAEIRAPRLVRDLAYSGIRADEVECDLTPAPRSIQATASDLRPAPMDLVRSDTVRVRRLTLGAATAEVLRRRFALVRGPSAEAQKRCARLLRGEDHIFAWQRQAFIERSLVRSVRRCSSLRPVIFDRDPRGGREGRVFASDGALARWAFG